MPILKIEGGQAFSFGNREDARVIQLSLDDAIKLISKYSIKRPSLRENLFGLFSFLNIGRNLKARYNINDYSKTCTKQEKKWVSVEP